MGTIAPHRKKRKIVEISKRSPSLRQERMSRPSPPPAVTIHRPGRRCAAARFHCALSEPLAAWMSRPVGPTSVVTLCLPLCRCEAPKHPAVDRCFRSVGSYCVPCRRHPGPWGPRASDPADAERGAWGAQLLQADGRSRATVGRPAVNASSWARGSI